MADGTFNNGGLRPIDPLGAIDKMIADMEQAELDALNQGLKPWEYNLSALTKQRTAQRESEEQAILDSQRPVNGTVPGDGKKTYDQRIKEREDFLIKNMTGNFIREDVARQAKQDIDTEIRNEQLYGNDAKLESLNKRATDLPSMEWGSGENKRTVYVLGNKKASPQFDIGGENYQFIDYTDEAAKQVEYDENGNVKDTSPIKPVGIDNTSGKPILISKQGYKKPGIEPSSFMLTQFTVDPNERYRTFEEGFRPHIGAKGDEGKVIDMIENNTKQRFNNIGDVIDKNASDMVRNLQNIGLLRSTDQLGQKTVGQKADIAKVSEEELQKRKEYAGRETSPHGANMTEEEKKKWQEKNQIGQGNNIKF